MCIYKYVYIYMYIILRSCLFPSPIACRYIFKDRNSRQNGSSLMRSCT